MKIATLKDILTKMSKTNRDLLLVLLKFLKEMCNFADKTKMNAQNLSLVWSPNLIRDPSDANMSQLLENMNYINSALNVMIEKIQVLSPEESVRCNDDNNGKHNSNSGSGVEVQKTMAKLATELNKMFEGNNNSIAKRKMKSVVDADKLSTSSPSLLSPPVNPSVPPSSGATSPKLTIEMTPTDKEIYADSFSFVNAMKWN